MTTGDHPCLQRIEQIKIYFHAKFQLERTNGVQVMAFQSLEGIKVDFSKMISYLGHYEKQVFLKNDPKQLFLTKI
jgi:hypothetical protein